MCVFLTKFNTIQFATIFQGGLQLSVNLKGLFIRLSRFGVTEIVMRRDGPTQRFRGSAFVTFPTEAMARQFVDHQPNPIYGTQRMMQLQHEGVNDNAGVNDHADLDLDGW